MVRRRLCLVLAMMLVLPPKIVCEDGEEDDIEDTQEDDLDDKPDQPRTFMSSSTSTTKVMPVVATRLKVSKHPVECYVCQYSPDSPLRSCLDPVKHKIHSIICPNAEDRCFTSITAGKRQQTERVLRGCRTECIATTDTACCEFKLCNNQVVPIPVSYKRTLTAATTNKSDKSFPPNVLFFVTILLLLQTVVKVAIV